MRTYSSFLLIALPLLLAGCDSQRPAQPSNSTAHVHDHSGHDHSGHPETGPHGGHLVELGDEEFHLEWTHDDDAGQVTVYVLDAAAKDLIPIAAPTLRILSVVEDETKGRQATEFQLAAVNPAGDPPLSAQFSLEDPALLMSINLAGQGSEVSLPITILGKEYIGKFEQHDHADHGHHH